MALLYPFFRILLSRKIWFPKVFKLKKIWAHLLCIGGGVVYVVSYEEELDPNKTYVFCCNHTSYYDIILSYCIIDNYFVFMGKKELEKVPLFNIFFKEMNILVDRKSITDAHKAFKRAGDELDANNSIIIFPEGTISRDAPKMRVFKNGAFKLAIDKQVEIVPITFKNVWNRLQDRPFLQGKAGPGKVDVFVHKPIPTIGMNETNLEELKLKVRNCIETKL
jgi:1-acyl-sn-glycerol-3-phosphate acyltransferase